MASRPPGPDQFFFDLWSRFYDAPLVQRITYRPEHDAVLKRLRGTAPGRVLDIACGTGLLGARIGRELPGTRVVGCDFSRGMLEQAARQGRLDCLVQGSALELPFEGGAFDAVVTTEAFHWFPDQAQALREFRRVLAPGGRILVSLVNPPLEVPARRRAGPLAHPGADAAPHRGRRVRGGVPEPGAPVPGDAPAALDPDGGRASTRSLGQRARIRALASTQRHE